MSPRAHVLGLWARIAAAARAKDPSRRGGRRTEAAPVGGDFRVDHVYIDDCVEGISKVLDKPQHRYDVYHIATGEAPSLAEIVDIIKELVPDTDLAIGPGPYRFVDGTEAVRKGALDITRARTELGYQPRYPIKNGLAAYIEATRAGRG
jgi:nucleoside-diphosphate-sugar epimerase